MQASLTRIGCRSSGTGANSDASTGGEGPAHGEDPSASSASDSEGYTSVTETELGTSDMEALKRYLWLPLHVTLWEAGRGQRLAGWLQGQQGK
jgi:hypothetical protein